MSDGRPLSFGGEDDEGDIRRAVSVSSAQLYDSIGPTYTVTRRTGLLQLV